MSRCGDNKNTINKIIESGRLVEELHDSDLKRLLGKNSFEVTEKIAAQLEKDGYDAHTFITKEELHSTVVKMWGKESERIELIASIMGILRQNKGLTNLFEKFVLARLPSDVMMVKKTKEELKKLTEEEKKGITKEGYVRKGYVTESGVIDLMRFQVGRLRLFNNKLLDLVNQVNLMGSARAKIGNYRAQFKSPGKLAWLDPTGAFEATADAVREHAGKISSKINWIMSAPEFLPDYVDKKLKKAAIKIGGMEKVNERISNLYELGEKKNVYPEVRAKFHRLFQMTMKNHVFIGKPVETIKKYDRSTLQNNPDKVYLFGDNLLETGKGGQAIIRGMSNAIGIPTKKKPTMENDAFMTDLEYDKNVKAIDEALDLIPTNKTLVLPEDGIGTGLAQLEARAPKTYAYLQRKLKALKNRENKFYINGTYDARKYKKNHPDVIAGKKKVGAIMTYESTGDVMWSFQKPVLLETYIPMSKSGAPIGKKGEYFIDMNPEQFRQFQKALKDGRVMTDITFEVTTHEMAESTENLFNSLYNYYDGKLSEHVIKQVFFFGEETVDFPSDFTRQEYESVGYTLKNRIEEGQNIPYIDLLEPLTKEERQELDIVKDTFNMTVSDGMVIANQGAFNPEEPEYRKNYYPTKYWDDNLRFMMDILLKEWQGYLDNVIEFQNKGKFKDRAQAEKTQEMRVALEKRIDSATTIINNMDNYHFDLTGHGGLMHFAADNKHFKRISNAYDIRNSRYDAGLYYDSLADQMSVIERNNLATAIVETLRRTKEDRLRKKPKLTKEERITIIEAAVNLHRTTYHSVKTAGMFGDTEQVTKVLNAGRMAYPPNWAKKALKTEWIDKDVGFVTGVPYTIQVTPEMQQRFFRYWTSMISGLFLQNWKSAVTNATGSYQGVIETGIERTMNSIKMYNYPGRYEKGITRLIQQSSVTEFSDFFSKQMVNAITDQQLETQVTEAIMKEMLLYHMRIEGTVFNKKISRAKSRKKFDETIYKYLGRSEMWIAAEEIEIKSKERTVARIKEVRSRMRLDAAAKLVQWAINKEYELKPMVTQGLFKRWANTGFGMTVVKAGDLIRATKLTMGNTEKFVRSIAFINGVQNAWEIGALRNDIHWSQYTEEKDVDLAIRIGREVSYQINFGMSTQDVASYQYGPAAPFGKFKYWLQQKAEADQNAITNSILSLSTKDIRDSDKKAYKLKPILKMLYNANLSSNRKNRLARPDIAAVRTIWISQGIGTIIWNLFFLNPISMTNRTVKDIVSLVKGVLYQTGSATQMRGFMTSSVMHWLTLPIVYGIRRVIDGHILPDDEEEWDEEISLHMENTPFAGYAVVYLVNAMFATYALLDKRKELFIKKAEQLTSLKYGRPQLGFFRFLQKGTQEASKALLEVFYDIMD